MILFLGMFFSISLLAQDDQDWSIPHLCANGKYKLVDRTGTSFSDCIYDSLAISTYPVTFGVIDGKLHFVTKDGAISKEVLSIKYSANSTIKRFNKLSGSNNFYILSHDEIHIIFNLENNEWYGPFRNLPIDYSRLSYYDESMDTDRPFVFFLQEGNLIALSGKSFFKKLATSNKNDCKIIMNYLIELENEEGNSIIYNQEFDEVFKADTILYSSSLAKENMFAIKDGRKYLIKVNANSFTPNDIDNSTIEFIEVPPTMQWVSGGYSYHKSPSKEWIEDREGKLFYTLKKEERVIPYSNNIICYNGNLQRFLICNNESLICKPHLKIQVVGKRSIYKDELGYRILDWKKQMLFDEIFLNAIKVDGDMIYTKSNNGVGSLWDKDLNLVFNTQYEVSRKFLKNTYVYKVDSLYGLLDSLGKVITPPLSTRSDLYCHAQLDWIKMQQGELCYLYNINTKVRTEGIHNEFRISDRHFDEDRSNLIYGLNYTSDSVYYYRQDGSLFESMTRKGSQYFQKEKNRYTRKEVTRNNYIYIDQFRSDTLLTCNECEGMYMIQPNGDYITEYVICSYRKWKKDLYDKRGKRLLPDGMSMLPKTTMDFELSFYPEIIVQKEEKVGVYNIIDGAFVIPLEYDNISRRGRNRLSLKKEGFCQITDLRGKPVNDELYYRTHELSNGDIAAQFPRNGTHKKRVYFDSNDPDIDPCEGKEIDAPNYYYKIIKQDGTSRFDAKFLKYVYKSDDLISVVEWTESDTLFYGMNISGDKLKSTSEEAIYSPFHEDIFKRRMAAKYTFVTKDLEVIVNRQFKDISYTNFEKGNTFYYAWDGSHTYVYNRDFDEKISIEGRYQLSRFGDSMLYLYNSDNGTVRFLHLDGSPFSDDIVKHGGRNHRNGIKAYRKDNKLVFVDLLKPNLFWD